VAQGGEETAAGAWTDQLNEAMAVMVETDRQHFSGVGVVSQGHPKLLADQLVRVHELGLVGVLIGTQFGNRELDDPQLDDFFATAEELGALLFVHPIATTLDDAVGDRMSGPEVRFGLGMGTDTAIAASKLVFGGVIARHPGLKICLAHGGGTFFWSLARSRRLMSTADLDLLEQRLRHVFVDSVVYDLRNLRHLLDVVGYSRVLFGTDYPLPAEDISVVGRLDRLSDREATGVAGGNARALLGYA
jgi:aminocarboxymuconate-semialdehyde decarboxylase